MLSKKERAILSELQNTFETSGWQHLKNGWKEEQKQLPEAMFFNAKSIADLDAARVRYGLLTELINLPETLEEQSRQLEEDKPE